jgi:MoaA/NifB/PqqE/SkfB family radical SAM enzyme
MHPDIVEIVQGIGRLGPDVGLVTNGLLLDRIFPVADQFSFIRVSVDAGTPETYSRIHRSPTYNTVMSNIGKLLTKTSPEKVGLAYLVIPENAVPEEVLRFTERAVQLGVRYVVFRPAIITPKMKSNWKKGDLRRIHSFLLSIQKSYKGQLEIFLSSEERWRRVFRNSRTHNGSCMTCLLKGIIKADGSVPFCHLSRRIEERALGNIYDEEYPSIWGNGFHRSLLEKIDIKNCPIPCCVDDYRDVLYEHEDDIRDDTLPDLDIRESSHYNFL